MGSTLLFICSVIILVFSRGELVRGCDQKRSYGADSFVCVCNLTACDSFPPIISPDAGFYLSITSSRDEFRYDLSSSSIDSVNSTTYEAFARIFINSSDVRQTMFGFGAAFTDSSGINVAKLSEPLQEMFMRQYFSSDGLEYNIGRIPIGGCDFSTHPYSYDDVDGDVDLLYFNLTEEDHVYKIPLIKKAQELSDRKIYLFASPWSPPTWMKTNGMFNGSGSLLPEMQQPWANYFVKFLNAYEDEGITLWGLTAQNEPSAGATDYPFNCCHFTGEGERVFVRDYLGPTLSAAGYQFLKLMVGDDDRIFYPRFLEPILNDEECSSFVDGIAVHWYTDDVSPASILDEVHSMYPDKFIIYTESCTGYLPQTEDHVILGSWERGEKYAENIINNINHWSAGWMDWNLGLDMIGGPNWASNFVDSSIIINEETNEFYKQPMFYALGHFSKFITEGSMCVGTTIKVLESSNGTVTPAKGNIDAASFLDTNGYTVSVVINKNEEEKAVAIEDSSGNVFFRVLPPKSFQTFVYAA